MQNMHELATELEKTGFTVIEVFRKEELLTQIDRLKEQVDHARLIANAFRDAARAGHDALILIRNADPQIERDMAIRVGFFAAHGISNTLQSFQMFLGSDDD